MSALFERFPVGRQLLCAYARLQERLPAGSWLERIEDAGEVGVEELDTEELSRLHGKLIALGLLEYEVSTKGTGVRYQISTLGRLSLMRACGDEETDEDPRQGEERSTEPGESVSAA